jgi:hypothetical protein
MPTIIERDVRPMKIAFEFPTCQRRRGAPPKSANRGHNLQRHLSIRGGQGRREDKPIAVRREKPACEIAWPSSTTSVSVIAKNRHY